MTENPTGNPASDSTWQTTAEPTAQTTETFAPPSQPSRRVFRRSRTDRMLGGVCGGLAETLGVDPTLLRIATAALTVLGGGAGAVLYLVCWLVVPEADEN